MNIDAQDLLAALKNQRNSSFAALCDESAMLSAMLEAAKREIAAKDKEIAELKKPPE